MSRASELRNQRRRIYKDVQEALTYHRGLQAQAQVAAHLAGAGYNSHYGTYGQYQQPAAYGQQYVVPANGVVHSTAVPATSCHEQAQASYPYAAEYDQYNHLYAQGYPEGHPQEGVDDDNDYGANEDENTDERKNQVPMKHNAYYNVNTLLATNILRCQYFRSLYEKTAFNEVVDEIYYKVDHVEPWLSGGSANTPSTAFCLLYKFFTMKLTSKQMRNLLEHQDSPFIRAIGFLYLRYTCPPEELWNWIEPYIDDAEEFTPSSSNKRVVTIGNWVQRLVSDHKYYGTVLPRIPKTIEMDIQVKMLKQKGAEGEIVDATEVQEGQLKPGTVVRARYSEDGKWYDARIEEPGKIGTYWVTYLPEEEYGNQEEVELKNIKVIANGKKHEMSEETLRRRVIERNRREATANDKRDYAKGVSTFKTSISMPLTKKRRPESPVPFDHGGSKTAEEALMKQGRLGHIESEAAKAELDPQKKRERELLLARYGNAASAPKKAKS